MNTAHHAHAAHALTAPGLTPLAPTTGTGPTTEACMGASDNGVPRPSTLGEAGAALASEALLQGQREVNIAHNGQLYRLQATRQGKLILTK